MNFNENIKSDLKCLYIHELTNFNPKLLSHFVTAPVIQYDDKFIDVLGIDDNNLICIFMNID